MKKQKVDGKFRVGGKPDGTHATGVGKHEMSDGVKHVGHVPKDAGKSN